MSYNPFDPIQDTERMLKGRLAMADSAVTTHSIRYRILKEVTSLTAQERAESYNPFDPIQDTERERLVAGQVITYRLQPIRSDTGY